MRQEALGYLIILINLLARKNVAEERIENLISRLRIQSIIEDMFEFCLETQLEGEELMREIEAI